MRVKHGYFGTPTYISWMEMRRRCYDTSRKDYQRYGACGIRVCKAWDDPQTGFAAFLRDMGPRPPGRTIGRIRHDEDYGPDNCRWETVAEQNENRRNTRQLYGDDGVGHSIGYWRRLLGRQFPAAFNRLGKRCTKCQCMKKGADFFGPVASWCKACHAEYSRNWKAKNRQTVP